MSLLSQNNTSKAQRVYGGPGDQAARSSVNTAGQAVPEALQISTTANNRRFKGPARAGNGTLHWFNSTPSGATSSATIDVSNLPDPDPAVDAHWAPSGLGPIDLTTSATASLIKITGLFVEWMRVKPSVVTSAGTVWAFVSCDSKAA